MLDGAKVARTYDVAAAVAMATRVAFRWGARESQSSTSAIDVPAWTPRASWQTVDQALRAIQRVRDGLDADEARWLRDAERMQIWRHLGMVSALDYCERVLGLAPRTAKERLRVARALAALPAIEDELRAGHLTYSTVRELARVAASNTETRWIDHVRGKSLREVQELVAGHRRGDLPSDAPEPDLRTRPFVFDLTPRVRTLLLAAVARIRTDAGHDLEDDAIVEALAQAVLGDESTSRESGRARYQIAFNVCRQCDHAEQHVHGYSAPVTPEMLERVRCDAITIGDLDATTPERASQSIPPATARLVWHRDQGRCQTPGCRSKHGLEIHHIVRRADGGSHDPSNLTVRCSACHQAHHDGRVTIGGAAPGALTFVRHEPTATLQAPVVAASSVLGDAVQAIVGLGFSKAIASAAVDAASDHADAGLLALLRAALAKCPRPST